MKLNTFFLLSTSIFLILIATGCFLLDRLFTESVYRSSTSKRNYLTVKTYTMSHCGYTDIYAQKFDRGKLTYELYYGCTPVFSAKKIVYTYNEKNKVVDTTKYQLVENTVFDTPFDSLDRFVLHKIDSFRLQFNPTLREYRLCNKSYKGLMKIQ